MKTSVNATRRSFRHGTFFYLGLSFCCWLSYACTRFVPRAKCSDTRPHFHNGQGLILSLTNHFSLSLSFFLACCSWKRPFGMLTMIGMSRENPNSRDLSPIRTSCQQTTSNANGQGRHQSLAKRIFLFNSDDKDMKTFFIDNGISTYELEKTEMGDAYNARGLYSRTVSRAKQMPHGRGCMNFIIKDNVLKETGAWAIGMEMGMG
jgi:hypothetical protein